MGVTVDERILGLSFFYKRLKPTVTSSLTIWHCSVVEDIVQLVNHLQIPWTKTTFVVKPDLVSVHLSAAVLIIFILLFCCHHMGVWNTMEWQKGVVFVSKLDQENLFIIFWFVLIKICKCFRKFSNVVL